MNSQKSLFTNFYLPKVVDKLCKGLNLGQGNNIFGLFEKCGLLQKNIEERTILADVLAKFERYKNRKSLYKEVCLRSIIVKHGMFVLHRYKVHGLTSAGDKWKLFFKVFCFLVPGAVPEETVEAGFLYEQVR